MAYQNLLIADDNGSMPNGSQARTITINRPEQLNALNRTFLVFGSFVQRRRT